MNMTANDFDFNQQVFLVSLTTLFSFEENIRESEKLSNEYYPPPILVRDIQLLDEVFLI